MIYLALGSNLGDKLQNLSAAIHELSQWGDVTHASSILTNPAMLAEGSPAEWDIPFVNQVIGYLSPLSPEQLLQTCQAIENKLGRDRSQRWAPRTIDIDILWYHGLHIQHPHLCIPHPGTFSRSFVTPLLYEIAPCMKKHQEMPANLTS